jgi:hypothetical protein
MKKLKITLISILASAVMTVSSYSMDFKIGLSAGFAALEASGTETLKDSSAVTSHTEQANAVIPSIFVEVAMDNGFGIGLDSVTGSANLAGSNHESKTMVAKTDGSSDTGQNIAQAEVTSIRTAYLIKQFQNGLLIKIGRASADVNTLETLATGTTYGTTSVDGAHIGIGYQAIRDNGIFFRASVENTNFDTLTLTGTQAGADATSFNVIKADVDVQTAKFSIGKSF